MKQDTLLSILLGCLLALSPLNIEAQTAGPVEQVLKGYPPVNATPPAVAEFTALVDLGNIPKAPIRNAPRDPCDGDKDNDPFDPFCYWSCTLCLREDDIKTCPNAKDWGITYDDGPSPFTPAILDHLKAKGSTATFFVVGSRVSEHPDILKRMFDEGHQIGVHTWSHTPLTTLTDEVVIAELQWTVKAIEEVTGKKPVTMRPPQGDHDDRIRFIAKELGLKVVMWSDDPNDWMISENLGYDISWVAGNFSQWVKEPSATGRITLEHDLFEQSAKVAPDAINIVLDAGFTIKTVAKCMNQPAFVGDTPSNTTTTSPAASAAASATSAISTPTSLGNNQYSASSANLLAANHFIGLSITAVVMIVSYSLNL